MEVTSLETYIGVLPFLVAFLQKEIDIVSLRKADAHDACRDGLRVVANTTVPSKLVGNLAIAETLLTHLHHEFVVGVQLMRDTLMVRRKTLSLTTVTAAEGTRNTGRLLVEEIIVFVQNEGLGVVGLSTGDRTLEGLTLLRETVRSSALALRASDVVVILRIIVICLVLIIVLRDTEIIEAVELEVAIVELG